MKYIRLVFNTFFVIWWAVPFLWILLFAFEGHKDANEAVKDVCNDLLSIK